jgi:uncharacterized Tic20 family protein
MSEAIENKDRSLALPFPLNVPATLIAVLLVTIGLILALAATNNAAVRFIGFVLFVVGITET